MARPRITFTDAQLRQVEVLAGYGLAECEIAYALGVHPNTLANRKRDTDALAEAIARGKAKAAGLIGEALFKRAKNGDVPAIKWWEQTRRGLAEKQQHEHTGKDGGAMSHTVAVRFVKPAAPSDVPNASADADA